MTFGDGVKIPSRRQYNVGVKRTQSERVWIPAPLTGLWVLILHLRKRNNTTTPVCFFLFLILFYHFYTYLHVYTLFGAPHPSSLF
jgi:hypothetical protein